MKRTARQVEAGDEDFEVEVWDDDDVEDKKEEKKEVDTGKRVRRSQAGKRARAWFVTINYKDVEDVEATMSADVEKMKGMDAVYVVVGRHVGTKSHVPHIHALLRFGFQATFKRIKDAFPRASIEMRKGTDKQCKEYIGKDGMILLEIGVPAAGGGGQDAAECLEVVTELMEGKEMMDVVKAHPSLGVKHFANLEALERRMKVRKDVKLPEHRLYEWQDRLLKVLDCVPDPRQILWIYDEVGGAGKSWLSRKLMIEYGANFFVNGKTNDIMYLWNPEAREGKQPICVFDLTRQNDGQVNYSIMEQLKNGVGVSQKYHPCVKSGNTPHVVVMANFMPAFDKFSAGRLCVWRVHGPPRCIAAGHVCVIDIPHGYAGDGVAISASIADKENVGPGAAPPAAAAAGVGFVNYPQNQLECEDVDCLFE